MINISKNALDSRAEEDNTVDSDGWRWVSLRCGWSRKAILMGNI